MKILIVDRHNNFSTKLKEDFADYGDRIALATAASEHVALNIINKSRPDLTIVDYRLDDTYASKELFRMLKVANLPFIVIARHDRKKAYNDIFNFNPVAFFCMPLDFMALKYHIDRMLLDKRSLVSSSHSMNGDHFVFKWNSQLRKERYSEIKFIYAEGNYITLYINDKEYLIRYSLRTIESELPTNKFVRVHRNYIVNLNRVQSIDIGKNLVNLDSVQLPVGRKYKQDIKESFAQVDAMPIYKIG